MTVVASSLKRGGILSPLPPSHGVSVDALFVQDAIRETWKALARSFAVRNEAETAIDELRRVQVAASVQNWDGYGAKPVHDRAVEHAIGFIRSLPTTVPTPDVSADPDGDVDLLWFVNVRKTLSVSVGPNGRLAYATLVGDNRAYGTEWFTHEIPQPILYSLSRVLGVNNV